LIVFTRPLCNILPSRVKPQLQLFAGRLKQNNAVIVPEYSARDLLAANLQRLMAEHPDKDSPDKLSKACFWPAGRKKGENVAPRTIRYALDARVDADPPVPSPSLDLIIAIANAFEVPAWQLVADQRILRLSELGKLFTMSESVSDQQVERHLPLPPEPSKRKRAS
jgi:hypothetical protein